MPLIHKKSDDLPAGVMVHLPEGLVLGKPSLTQAGSGEKPASGREAGVGGPSHAVVTPRTRAAVALRTREQADRQAPGLSGAQPRTGSDPPGLGAS